MNLILAIPLEVRLIAIFVLGTCVGSLANLGIYRLAWHPRPIGPWLRPDSKAPPRRLGDRIPIVGWLGLRREAGVHGPGFWVRPMLLELLVGFGFAALYWWEIGAAGLLPAQLPRPVTGDMLLVLHAQFGSHLALISLMLIASVIDVDEQIIPDSITVPGTWLGLLLAAACPLGLLPSLTVPEGFQFPANFWQQLNVADWPFLHLASPNLWPNRLGGFPHGWPLAAGLGCWWLWCVALMPRTWYPRHGWDRAVRLCFARVVREAVTRWILLMGLIGSAAIVGVWLAGGSSWPGLFSGLVGMAAGGGVIWMVRIVGTAALKREAMGFGDVTLMAMIGAFLGWQTCLVIFFMAPFAGLAVGIVQLVLRRGNVIPYGPFLCLATVAVIVRWADVWGRTWPHFALGWIVPVVILACMALLGVLLALWQAVRDAFR